MTVLHTIEHLRNHLFSGKQPRKRIPSRYVPAVLHLLIVSSLLLSLSARAQQSTVLVGSGSTVPLPLYNKWAAEYNKRQPQIQLQYVPLGTSEGIKVISKGAGDFGAGEVPLTAQQRAEGNLMELPSVLIAIVPIYNVPGTHQELRFSGELLAEIYLGRIKMWNAPQIARLNPDIALPDIPIKVVYRPTGKGSNYVFTDFLSKTSPAFRSQIGTSASPSWPVGSPAERSSDMAMKVKNEPGSIGYVEHQYAVENQIPYGLVENSAGKFIKASIASITAACQAVEPPQWDKFSASLANAPGMDSYPITSFTWLYLRTTAKDHIRSGALVDLLNWIYSRGQQSGTESGYSALPPKLLAQAKLKINSLR